MADENKIASDFTLLDQNEKEISLKDYRGKWVVLYFYPKDNTSGCTREACDFTDNNQFFLEMDAEIIGISPDSSQSHRKFIEKHNLGINLLSDPEKKVIKEYGAWGIKKNYGREYEGLIRSTFLISPDGIVEKVWRNVKVRVKRKSGEVKHAEVVKETLQQLRDSYI